VQRRIGLAAVVAAGLLSGLAPGPTRAQQAVYASEGRDSAAALTARALECLRRGEAGATAEAKKAAYREGLALARQAIAADERNADAHFAAFANNGRILLLEGVTANPISLMRASRDLDRALELNPNHPDAVAAKGGLYRQLPWVLGGDLHKAEEYLRRAIELDPKTILPRIELAATYRDLGEPARGLSLLEEAIVLAKREGKTYRAGEAEKLLADLRSQR
jgi:tetratricopeptide (TPR) repeat protein